MDILMDGGNQITKGREAFFGTLVAQEDESHLIGEGGRRREEEEREGGGGRGGGMGGTRV